MLADRARGPRHKGAETHAVRKPPGVDQASRANPLWQRLATAPSAVAPIQRKCAACAEEEKNGAVPTVQRSCSDGQCDSCAGGKKDLWITVYFRRKANEATMKTIRSEINGAKKVLKDCCLNLKADFDWRFLPGGGKFDRGSARPAGDAKGVWDYPEAAEELGEGKTFEKARGVPMLVVDEILDAGEGTSVTSFLDKEFTGRNYFVLAVNPARVNPTCNTIAHELWHIAGGSGHDSADGPIVGCTGNGVSDKYCEKVRALA